MKVIVYDCEIEKAILDTRKGEVPIEGINYCGGWQDFAGMGLSCVGAYDYAADRYRLFCHDNRAELTDLVGSADLVIGFNSLAFDNPLLAAAWGIQVPAGKSYDLLVEVWRAAGLGDKFLYPSHAGYGLQDLAVANGLPRKTGHGALAPVKWQRGEIGGVCDYCLHDVWLTKRLVTKVVRTGLLSDPKDQGTLKPRRPFAEGIHAAV